MGGLDAAALIDRDVDDHRARLHRAHHVFGDHHRCPAPWHEDRTDDQVRVGDTALDRAPVRGDRGDATHLDLIDVAEPVDVLVQQIDFGFQSGRHPGGVPTDVACAEHDDPGRSHAGCSTHQDTPAAVVALQEVRAHLHAHPSGDLAHRGEQRQRTVGQLHGLVRDAAHPAVQERVGDRRIGCEVQIGEEDQPRAEVGELRGQRFLDLADQLGALPDLVRGLHDRCAGALVVGVGDRGVDAGPGLDQHRRTVVEELADAVGCDRHPVLLGLDLLGHTDGQRFHVRSLAPRRAICRRIRRDQHLWIGSAVRWPGHRCQRSHRGRGLQ